MNLYSAISFDRRYDTHSQKKGKRIKWGTTTIFLLPGVSVHDHVDTMDVHTADDCVRFQTFNSH